MALKTIRKGWQMSDWEAGIETAVSLSILLIVDN